MTRASSEAPFLRSYGRKGSRLMGRAPLAS